jgi:hypothetical protein
VHTAHAVAAKTHVATAPHGDVQAGLAAAQGLGDLGNPVSLPDRAEQLLQRAVVGVVRPAHLDAF